MQISERGIRRQLISQIHVMPLAINLENNIIVNDQIHLTISADLFLLVLVA